MLSVSAVIPAHNRERYIGDALESVLRQDRPVDEIIVVDDGSTDDTARITASFSNVQLVRLGESRGTSGARNAGIAAARGDVLAWLDSDDVWFHDHTRTTVGLLERHQTAVAAFTNAEYFGDRDGLWPRPDVPDEEPFDALSTAFRQTISTMSPAVTRRAAVQRIGGFDESLRSSVDFDLFLRLSITGQFVSSSRVTTRYRWHGDQISSRPVNQLKSMYVSRNKLLRLLIDNGSGHTAAELAVQLRGCWHDDLWLAWAKHDSTTLGVLSRLVGTLPEIGALAEPFSSESLSMLHRYCRDRGKREAGGWPDAGGPRLLGRPRWLYAQAFKAQVRYWRSRLTKRREDWLGPFMDAAVALGRLDGPT